MPSHLNTFLVVLTNLKFVSVLAMTAHEEA